MSGVSTVDIRMLGGSGGPYSYNAKWYDELERIWKEAFVAETEKHHVKPDLE